MCDTTQNLFIKKSKRNLLILLKRSSMMRSYLICESLSVRYAIPVEHIKGIYWLPELFPIDAAPPWFVGSINWHGDIVHVLDLGLRFKHPARKYTSHTQLVMVSLTKSHYGIVVDAVLGVIEVPITAVTKRDIVIPIDFNPSYSALIESEIKQEDEIYQLINLQHLLTVEVGQEIYQSGYQSPHDVTDQSSTNIINKLNNRMSQFSSPLVEDRSGNLSGFVLVIIGGVQYAIEVQYITEFTHLKQFVVLPCCPDYLLGVINLRGAILSVIDMAYLINVHNSEDKKDLVILSYQSLKFALAVEKIICFQYFDRNFVSDIQNTEDQHVHCKSLLKVDQGIAGILDIEAIFKKGLLEIDVHV